jgi:hypothetical protein
MLALLFVAVSLITTASAEESAVERQSDILCVCRCCYLGDCAPLENASWPVSTCKECSVGRCRAHVESLAVRRKIAHNFEWFQRGDNDGDGEEDDKEMRSEMSDEERALIKSHRMNEARSRFDVCEVVAVTEAVSCASSSASSACAVSTDITAECYDRHAFVVKYTTFVFLTLLFLGLVLGFTKNYLPSFNEFNDENFDY